MTETLTTRPVTPNDLELICRHREQMFRDGGAKRPDEILQEMTRAFRTWLKPRLADGTYFGFIAEVENKPIAGIGLMTIDWPPHPSHPSQDKRGYVLNVFVEPSHRKRGIAPKLMGLAEAEFKKRSVDFVILHATTMGRPLYDRLGWKATSEMSKFL